MWGMSVLCSHPIVIRLQLPTSSCSHFRLLTFPAFIRALHFLCLFLYEFSNGHLWHNEVRSRVMSPLAFHYWNSIVLSWQTRQVGEEFHQVTTSLHHGTKRLASEWRRYLLSSMVGLFLWRIFLKFPRKLRGGNRSRGKLARRPRTASSRPSADSVSLPATSLAAASSADMSDGREPTPTSVILPEKSSEAVPGSPPPLSALALKSSSLNFGQSENSSCAEMEPQARTTVFNLCTCRGSPASYSNIHELGRY